jgi:flagellar biosynthesis GTPase FlhF
VIPVERIQVNLFPDPPQITEAVLGNSNQNQDEVSEVLDEHPASIQSAPAVMSTAPKKMSAVQKRIYELNEKEDHRFKEEKRIKEEEKAQKAIKEAANQQKIRKQSHHEKSPSSSMDQLQSHRSAMSTLTREGSSIPEVYAAPTASFPRPAQTQPVDPNSLILAMQQLEQRLAAGLGALNNRLSTFEDRMASIETFVGINRSEEKGTKDDKGDEKGRK